MLSSARIQTQSKLKTKQKDNQHQTKWGVNRVVKALNITKNKT